MADDTYPARPEYGRTFTTAMWVVGVLAILQVGAATWAVLSRSPKPAAQYEVALPTAAGEAAEAAVEREETDDDNRDGEVAGAAWGSEEGRRTEPAEAAETPGAGPTPTEESDGGALEGEFTLAPESASAESAEPSERSAAPSFAEPSFPVAPSADGVLPFPDANLDGSEGESRGEPAPPTGEFSSQIPFGSPASGMASSGIGSAVAPGAGFSPGGAAGAEPSLTEALRNAEGSVPAIEDSLLAGLLSTGREHRSSGNMLKALEDFRDVEDTLPEHPGVLSELAATYSQMGQEEKAKGYWERVVRLGPERAGDFLAIADKSLKGESLPPPGSPAEVLKIREVVVEELPSPEEGEEGAETGGQRVSLHVSVEGVASADPVATDMVLLVHFYDLVNGEKIAASTADTTEEFPTEPYDWQDGGVEEVNVIYHQPEFTEEQKRELGEREYHGYVIELFYDDRLQDTVAKPPVLQQMRVKQGAPPPGHESVPGPENALFPEEVFKPIGD